MKRISLYVSLRAKRSNPFQSREAFSVIEYVVLVVIIIGAFVVMRNYIQRGIFALWKQDGDSLAFGRQYDSQKTIECAFDEVSNIWYDRQCFVNMRAKEIGRAHV